MEIVDLKSYPTLARYLIELPEGIASYPACRARSELTIPVCEQYPDFGRQEDLPAAIRGPIGNLGQPNCWVPEVHAMAQMCVLRDTVETSDALLLDGIATRREKTFSSFVMRGVMYMLSPKLVAMGAAKRWSLLHEGTELTSETGSKNFHLLRLNFPPHLYTKLMLLGFARSYEVALKSNRSTNACVTVERHDETSAQFKLMW